MLVLTRKPGQKIEIGNGIVLTLVSTGRGQVRIGIEAPREVSIVREELLTAQRTQAAQTETNTETVAKTPNVPVGGPSRIAFRRFMRKSS